MRSFIFSFISIFLLSLMVHADEIRAVSLQIKALDTQNYDVIWKVPAKKNGEKLALYVKFDEDIKLLREPMGIYLDGYYVENKRIFVKEGLEGRKIFIEGLSASSAEVLLRYIASNHETVTGHLSATNPEYIFKDKTESFDTMKTYTFLGIEHILEGLDHLLFVACLVIIASSFSKLLWTITGFTLAHSVTLVLSTLGWFSIPIPPMEAAIALSIIFLALEIVKGNKQSLTYRYPVAVSSSFGLLHGFGFASVLTEIGLPQEESLIALLFFNIGVEIGQIIFVVFLLILGWIGSKLVQLHGKNIWERVIGYTIGTVSTFWLLQRVVLFVP